MEAILVIPTNVFLFLLGIRFMRSGVFSPDENGKGAEKAIQAGHICRRAAQPAHICSRRRFRFTGTLFIRPADVHGVYSNHRENDTIWEMGMAVAPSGKRRKNVAELRASEHHRIRRLLRLGLRACRQAEFGRDYRRLVADLRTSARHGVLVASRLQAGAHGDRPQTGSRLIRIKIAGLGLDMFYKLYPREQIKNYLLIDVVLTVFLCYRVFRSDTALGLWGASCRSCCSLFRSISHYGAGAAGRWSPC